jgi:alpha-glucosidase
MLDVLRFWREGGAGGFRIDALRQVIKDDRWRDNPPNPDWDGGDPYHALLPEYTTDRPELRDVVRAMREAAGPDAFLLGELYLPADRAADGLLRLRARPAGELPPAAHAVDGARRGHCTGGS